MIGPYGFLATAPHRVQWGVGFTEYIGVTTGPPHSLHVPTRFSVKGASLFDVLTKAGAGLVYPRK